MREQNKTTNEQEVERQQTKSLLINRYADLDEKCDQRSEKIIADVNTLRKELDFNVRPKLLFDLVAKKLQYVMKISLRLKLFMIIVLLIW